MSARRLTTLTAALLLALLVPTAAASTQLRFYLKPGWTLPRAMRTGEVRLNRTAGFSNADCWMALTGSAKRGWRHAYCVGNLSVSGTTYRCKATWTPVSKTRERYTLAILGVRTQTGIVRVPSNSTFVIR
jgi:hypothetical protein